MKICLDACCLNRLTDDQSQRRIREEAEAVELILRRMRTGEVQWSSGEALTDEINRNPHLERRLANEIIEVDQRTASRAKNLEATGYGAFDALHLACAEAAQVDVLLTTDDGFVRKASRRDGNPRVPVRNPSILEQGKLAMSSLDTMTDEQFERHALEVLGRELGADGLARFLRLNRSGLGDYTTGYHRLDFGNCLTRRRTISMPCQNAIGSWFSPSIWPQGISGTQFGE